MRQIVLLAHNIRSTHNVGALFRCADGFGVEHIFCSGYTPYPQHNDDSRLPHISRKLTSAISKTALGAEKTVAFSYEETIELTIRNLKNRGYTVVALEQDQRSTTLRDYRPPDKVALIIGEEVHGITPELISLCDDVVEIPMQGKKESLNVSVATGIALYHMRSTR